MFQRLFEIHNVIVRETIKQSLISLSNSCYKY